ncbi:MAG: hypothetical protein RR651_00925, partial [Lysinibacillus sp.]
MSNSEIPDQSESTSSKLRVLQDVLIGQNEDVTLLCSVIEYIKCNKETGLDEQDITKYSNQISNLKLRQ